MFTKIFFRVCDLRQFRLLANVNLSHNKLRDLSFLSDESNIVELNMSSNRIEQLSTLPSLVSLNILHLNENKVGTNLL